MAPAGRAGAARVDGLGGQAMDLVAQVEGSPAGEGLRVAGGAGGKDAVHHVDAVPHRLQDVLRRAHPHQVARPVRRQLFRGQGQQVAEHLEAFPHRQAADGQAGEVQLRGALRALAPQGRKEVALHDPEQLAARPLGLPGLPGRQAAPRPGQGPLHRLAGLLLPDPGRGADIQGHQHVAAQELLEGHHLLGGEAAGGPVQVRAELRPLLRDPPQGGQGKDLVAPGIRKDVALPTHEGVQAAGAADHLGSGPQVQVIGVGQDDLHAQLFQPLRVDGLDRGVGAHGHEYRGLHPAVGKVQEAGPGGAVRVAVGAGVQHGGPFRSWRCAGSAGRRPGRPGRTARRRPAGGSARSWPGSG